MAFDIQALLARLMGQGSQPAAPMNMLEAGGAPRQPMPGNQLMAAAQPQMAPQGAPSPMPAQVDPMQTGSTMVPGSQGEIRRGPDGKNYQYAETTGMAGDNGGQGWIQTSMSPSGGGILDRFANSDFKGRLGDMFTGWAMGSTPQDSIGKGAFMTAQGNQGRKDKASQNQTVEWLKSQGMDEGQAKLTASSPATLSEFLKSKFSKKEPIEINGQLVDPDTHQVIGDFRTPADANSKLTTDQREYQTVKDQGYNGSFLDYQKMMKEAGRNQVNIDTGVKLPTGFRWKDPNNQQAGVEPIPGGPGEQIPAESAARIGMADSFLGQFDDLKKKVGAGEVTGVIDRFKAGNSNGVENETYRQIQSGTDALQRMLTGAGMNLAEAEAYANRYLPTYKDNATSASSKLDQLKRELESTKKLVMRGRGGEGTTTPPPADTNTDPLGIR